jgi:hypothetical protein
VDTNQLIEKALSRRTFLAGAGTTAAVGLLAGCSDNGTVTLPKTSATYGDTDILNFALNLEYLEASFYLYAATGKGLATADMGAGSASPYQTVGTVTPGNSAMVAGTSAAQQQIIAEIALEEQQHVRALRFLLGSAAVPMPNIDLSFFGPLAVAAGIYTSAQPAFNPYASFDAFLIGAFIFEDVGVTAYHGAAPLISAAGVTAGYLNDAAGILAVEAYHAAYIRTALTSRSVAAGATSPTDAKYPYVGIANQVEALRATLTVGASGAPGSSTSGNNGQPSSSGTVEVPLTVPTSTTSLSTIVAADSVNAVAFARSTNQVLHVVYGSPTVGVKSGGFFPSGMNSFFATTTA